MQRSGGVTLSAVVTIAGSLFSILFAAVMVFAANFSATQRNMPPFARSASFVVAGFFVLLAVWGIATAVGLFKLHPWSRISILIFGGLLALMAGISAVAIAFMPFPPAPNGQAVITTGIRVGIAIFYALFALLGAAWLYFFTRPKVVVQFEGGYLAVGKQGSRPLSITIIAVYLLFTTAMSLMLAFLPFPLALLGMMIKGWTGRLSYVAWGAVSLVLGLGLFKMNPLARKAALVYFVLVIANTLLYVLLPGLSGRMQESMDIISPGTGYNPALPTAGFLSVVMVVSSLIGLVPIWFLVKRRKAFNDYTVA